MTTQRTTPPFRADHVGSLLRPPALLDARARHRAGELDDDGLKAAEDRAIDEVIDLQRDAGLQTVTDGEQRRTAWHMDFIYQLDGIASTDEMMRVHFRNEAGDLDFESAALAVEDRVRLRHTIFGDDFTHLARTAAERAPGLTPKLTMPSPSMVHYRGGSAAISAETYPDHEQFWADLAAAYAEQLQRIADLGCTYAQLDDTSLAYLNDPAQREQLRQRGDDPDHQHERYIRTLNDAVADRPSTLRLTTHLCRGNYRSAWAAEGGYEFVAEALFSELAVDGFFLEYDDQRSGGFEPLRFVPPGKQVVLGLVTTKSPVLEDKDTLKRRIDEAARFVPLDQLSLSPQCGFSSTVEGNALTFEDELAKLRLVVEVAEEVWG